MRVKCYHLIEVNSISDKYNYIIGEMGWRSLSRSESIDIVNISSYFNLAVFSVEWKKK